MSAAMDTRYLQIAHVLTVIFFISATFVAYAAPVAERRKRMSMFSGILALLVLVTGFGLLDMAGHASAENALRYPLWSFVKMAVWLVVAVLGVAVFRQPDRARLFGWLTGLLALLAVVMVYLRPFS